GKRCTIGAPAKRGRHGEQTVKPRTAVWITGVGAITPVGQLYEDIADSLLEGRSGVRNVSGFDVTQHASQIAGQIGKIDCLPGWDTGEWEKLTRLEQLSLHCCYEALQDAGWWHQREELRIGLVLGLGAEWLTVWDFDAACGGTRLFSRQANAEPVVARTRRK